MDNINNKDIFNTLLKFETFRRKECLKYNVVLWGSVFMFFLSFFLFMTSFNFVSESTTAFVFMIFFSPIFMLASMLVGFIYAPKIKNHFKRELKKGCFKEILKNIGRITWFEHDSLKQDEESSIGLENDILDRSGLFGNYNSRLIDDEFKGTYKGIDYKISETNLRDVQSNGKGGKYYVNIFKGVVIEFNSNKKTMSRTVVATKGDITKKNAAFFSGLIFSLTLLMCFAKPIIKSIMSESIQEGLMTLLPSIIILIIFAALLIPAIIELKKFEKQDKYLKEQCANVARIALRDLENIKDKLDKDKYEALIQSYEEDILNANKDIEKLDKVTLEDPKFNKRFDVYSSDQVEARYLVTTAFMERLNNLTTAFGTNKVKCSFFGRRFMIAISTKKDLFEIGKINKPLIDKKAIENFYKELKSIYEMIDYFKLNEKTGL